jgi:uncharacterized protein (TIGR02246 family)
MATRYGFGFFAAGLLAAACAGDKPADKAADKTADKPAAAMTPQAAIDKLHADYATHFNLKHASAVADLYADSAVSLGADGAVEQGKAAIQKGLEGQFAASPTLALNPIETKIFGNQAVTLGSYTLAMTPAGGAATSLAGHYMTTFAQMNGAWKIAGVITNYDAPPPAGTPRDTTSGGPLPPENGTLKALVADYTKHNNLGHASAVAALYTDSSYNAFADAPPKQGRAAVEAYLKEQMSRGSPQLTIHEVGTTEYPGGWATDGGWYEIKAKGPKGPVNQIGAYMLLARKQADNSWQIHWSVNNGMPAPAMAAAKKK